MIGKDLRMKDMDKVGQNNFRFDRHLLIERHNFHVAIDYPMIFPCVKVSIAVVLIFQHLIAEISVETVDDSPIIGICRAGIDCFIIKRYSS